MAKAGKTITVEQIGSPIRRPAIQRQTLIGLGLNKMHRRRTLEDTPAGVTLEGGKIAVTGAGRTNVSGIWAGGDCAAGGDDLSVTAVAQGRDAAEDIHVSLTA